MGKTRVGTSGASVGEARTPKRTQAAHATPDPLGRAVGRLARAAGELADVTEQLRCLAEVHTRIIEDVCRALERQGGALAPPPPETP